MWAHWAGVVLMPQSAQVFGSQQREAERGNRHKRGYDYQWTKISRLKRTRQPVCEVCQEQPATEVDHIVPFSGLSDPLRIAWSNLRSICRQCHNRKTHGG